MARSKNQEKQADDFLLVGIRASARGVKPLLTFFDNLPSECNMSFVVIQHFDPKHQSYTDKIISHDNEFGDCRVEHEFPRIGRRVMLLKARRIPGAGNRPDLILLAFEDTTGKSAGKDAK